MDLNPEPPPLGYIDLDTSATSKNGTMLSDSSLQNGFASPPIIKELNDLSLPSSTPEESSTKSSSSTESTMLVTGRRSFLPTGLCYDDRMKLHANADWSASPHHPEDPRRIEAIMKAFREAGLVYTGTISELVKLLEISPSRWMWRIQAREATEAEICTAHTASHFHWARSLSDKTSEELRKLARELDMGRKSLYVGTLTYQAALISAGGAIETCKNVVAGKVKNAIAVIRPPGHHAEHNEPMGFCVFNNVPIAVKVCMADYPETCRRVLILDWDVHHGNGIQNIFYDDPNVLYISIHVYENGIFYPGQPDDPGIPDGGPENCGIGAGLGRNINIGWQRQGMGDGEYIAAFQRIVMPIAQEFDPDLVVISAGFDAAAGDELGGCFVSPECYSHMTHMLMGLAAGKVAVCLEGGYNLSAISRSALAVAKTLMGEPPERMIVPEVSHGAALVLHQARVLQSRYWQCMKQGVVPPQEIREGQGNVRLHDAIRSYQRRILTVRYNMVSLRVQRDKGSPSFEDQVLVTPGVYAAKKILLIIHDA
jgi:histone deacetylase 6